MVRLLLDGGSGGRAAVPRMPPRSVGESLTLFLLDRAAARSGRESSAFGQALRIQACIGPPFRDRDLCPYDHKRQSEPMDADLGGRLEAARLLEP
jgi:hypothetical protein